MYNPQSGKCLDDSGADTSNGAQLIIWTCSNPLSSNQVWRLQAGPVNSPMGRCLSVKGDATADGTAVTTATCKGNDAQFWTYSADNRLKAYDKCLDVTNGATAVTPRSPPGASTCPGQPGR